MEHIRRENAGDKGLVDTDEFDAPDPALVEVWAFMKATDWSQLPELGGYLDQSEWLMQQLMLIEWRSRILKAHDEANNADKRNKH